MSDKKISELTTASTINQSDVSVLVNGGVDYKFAFSTLLQFLSTNLTVGANISFGTILPQNTVGKNGDVLINTNSGSFAQKVSGSWNVVYTLPSVSSLTDGTVLYGLGLPGSSTGSNNDTYINTGSGIFYKKAADTWTQVFSMQTGPQGPQGTAGINGTNGINGFTILSGGTSPSNLTTGVNGDFYINTSNYTFFGPKSVGAWPAGVSLISPGVITGGSAGQALTKASDNDYDIEWSSLDDMYVRLDGNYSNPSFINSIPWTKISSKPTTIAGYGITDFNSLGDVSWLKLSGGTVTGDIQQTVSPVNANSLITKGFVESYLSGLSWKNSVKAASIGNLTLSGTQTIDGTAVVAGDRILVKNQPTQSQNGIYIVASGSWARAADADTTAEIVTATVLVRLGTVNKDTQWTCTNSNEPVIGTDAITFGQISAGTTYSNGTGISLAGTVFSLDLSYADARYSPLAGSSSLATVGTISSGIWHGTAIADSYISSASIWNAKQDAITPGNGLTLSIGVFSINPAYANAFTVGQTVQLDNIQTTYTDGIILTNTIAGTTVVQNQYSPSLRFHGSRSISSVANYSDIRLGVSWASNSAVFNIDGYKGISLTPTYSNWFSLDIGTGTLALGGNLAVNTIGAVVGGVLKLQSDIQIVAGTPGSAYHALDIQQSNTLSSGSADALIINSTYIQSGTASSIDLHVKRVETSLGSGTHFFAKFQVAGADKFSIDRTGTVITGIWNGTAIADMYISSASTWSAKQAALSGTGIVKSSSGTVSYLTDNSSNWNTAYTQTRQWDGGSTGLTAATGRASLGLVIGTDVLAYRTFGTAANTADADLVHIAGVETITGKKTVTDDFNVNAIFYAATNLATADLSAFADSSPFGKLLIGQNFSAAIGETNFMNSIGNSGSAFGGFRFGNVDWEGGVEDLLWLKGDTKSAVVNNIVTSPPTGSSVSTVKIGTVDSMSATLTTTAALTVEINGSTYHLALVH
ncbi:MAG: hypothetical protein V4553_13080 [Bacteroidota bacterium]